MLNKEVPSIELCKALEGLGWEREGLYWWNPTYDSLNQPEDYVLELEPFDGDALIAPTVVEMLEVLPERVLRSRISYYLLIEKSNGWFIKYRDTMPDGLSWIIVDESLPNALARMIIYLEKEGHIKLGVKGEI